MNEKFNFSRKETYTQADLDNLLEQNAEFARKGTISKDDFEKQQTAIKDAMVKAQSAEATAAKYRDAQVQQTTKSLFESLGGRKEAYSDFASRVKDKTDKLDFLTDQTDAVRLMVNETKKTAPHLFKDEAFSPNDALKDKTEKDEDEGFYPGSTIRKPASK